MYGFLKKNDNFYNIRKETCSKHNDLILKR